MSLVSPHCHYDPLCSGVRIIWLIAVNSLFCYCQDTAVLFCQKAGMCAKQKTWALPFPPCLLPLPPSLSLFFPFCALLGIAKTAVLLVWSLRSQIKGLSIYTQCTYIYNIRIFVYTAFHISQCHVMMGLGLLAGRVYLLFNKRSIGIAVFPGCLLGTFFDI